MKRTASHRPHLDHLRRQAKTLLQSLASSDDAAETFINHLPAARAMSMAQVRAAGFRLADAQSAIARQQGFASWPDLAAHVSTLRALEGRWTFKALCVDGEQQPAMVYQSSRIVMDGDRFRTEAMGAVYEGEFLIDVAAKPMQIDIHFVEGPEAGNVCQGIFALDGDKLEFCLALGAAARPEAFVSRAGSGHVYEALARAGQPPAVVDFEAKASEMYARLEGKWQAVSAMRDGTAMPEAMLRTFTREGSGHSVKVCLGKQVMIDARISIDDGQIDYLNADGSVQLGIIGWEGDEFIVCTAPAGAARPAEFASIRGSGVTLSRWRRA